MTRSVRNTLLVLAFLALGACASYQNTGGSGYDRYEISQEEIASLAGQVNNLHVLIERLRPFWLNGEIVVFRGQSLMGGTDYLAQLPPDYAKRLEFLDRSQATAQLPGLGSRRIDGAILIHTR